MKAILISIKPKDVAYILNGKKTILISKTCPAIFKHLKPYEGAELDVYIYCTNDRHSGVLYDEMTKKYEPYMGTDMLNGKVVAKFTLKKIRTSDMTNCLQGSCLSYDEVNEYTKGKKFYGWAIENLIIFDKPKELNEFMSIKRFNKYKKDLNEAYKEDEITLSRLYNGDALDGECANCVELLEMTKWCYGLTKAPRGWCYIEVGE